MLPTLDIGREEVDERSRQVTFMAKTYESALNVVVRREEETGLDLKATLLIKEMSWSANAEGDP